MLIILSFLLMQSLFYQDPSLPKIIDRPISFDEQRIELTLEYLASHYGLTQIKPTILPRMVVVHWTVIPTMEATFNTFNPSTLPNARADIQSASSLNVSSQFLVDTDGTIYRLMPETTMARHVIGLNHCAIGIENVGPGADGKLTLAQLEANVMLVIFRKSTPLNSLLAIMNIKILWTIPYGLKKMPATVPKRLILVLNLWKT